jgi:hypothetical protein
VADKLITRVDVYAKFGEWLSALRVVNADTRCPPFFTGVPSALVVRVRTSKTLVSFR